MLKGSTKHITARTRSDEIESWTHKIEKKKAFHPFLAQILSWNVERFLFFLFYKVFPLKSAPEKLFSCDLRRPTDWNLENILRNFEAFLLLSCKYVTFSIKNYFFSQTTDFQLNLLMIFHHGTTKSHKKMRTSQWMLIGIFLRIFLLFNL